MKKASKKIAAFALSLFALASFAIPAIATESVFAETQADASKRVHDIIACNILLFNVFKL